jgi:hypothetical protein
VTRDRESEFELRVRLVRWVGRGVDWLVSDTDFRTTKRRLVEDG